MNEMKKNDYFKRKIMGNGKWHIYEIVEQLFSAIIPGTVTCFMGLFITAEILGRIFFNNSFQGLVDIIENFVAVIAFLTIAAVQSSRSHITMDMVTNFLSEKRIGLVLDCIILVISIITMGCVGTEILWYTFRAYKTHITTVTLFWPVWPIALLMGFGVFLMIFRMILQFKTSLLKWIRWQETKIF